MSAPDHTSPGLPGTARVRIPLPRDGLGWWVLALVTIVVTARLTMYSLQFGCALTLIVLVLGLYVRNRTAGLAAMWTIWLVAPFLRRVFALYEPLESVDPLSLVPFLATAIVVYLELQQVTLSTTARRVLGTVTLGYALGLPFGLIHSPPAAAYALFAYLTALGCFVIGYREGGTGERLVLPRVLMVAAPLIAAYAFYQYYQPLPNWDALWRATADIKTVGAPEKGHIRVWGTLNSPGTFSIVLAIAGLALATLGRLNPWRVAAALAVFGALALTYVRSSWLALAVALVALVFASPGVGVRRVALIAGLMVVLGPAVLGGSTLAALGDRLDTFGSLGTDKSGGERSDKSAGVLGGSIGLIGGYGLGQAGEATQLSAGGGLRYSDNGYVALIYQVGPFGFLIVMTGLAMVTRRALANAWRRREPPDVLAFGAVVFMLVALIAGDALYGVGGMIFWYMGGLAVRRHQPFAAT